MGLFNVKSLLESENREMMGCNKSYKDNYIPKINCLDEISKISIELKNSYRNSMIDYHRNAIKTGSPKRSDLYDALSYSLSIAESACNDLRTRLEKQYNRNHTEYNLAEISLLDRPVTVYGNIPQVKEAKNVNLAESLVSACNGNKEYITESYSSRYDDTKSVRDSLRESYNYTGEHSSLDNLVEYMTENCYSKNDARISVYPKKVLEYAKRNNNKYLMEMVDEVFNAVIEDLSMAKTSVENLINNEIKSEAIPYPNPEEQNDSDLKNNLIVFRSSQFIENVCEKMTAIGYRTDIIFEMADYDKKICDLAQERIDMLKEYSCIDVVDIIIAESNMEVE